MLEVYIGGVVGLLLAMIFLSCKKSGNELTDKRFRDIPVWFRAAICFVWPVAFTFIGGYHIWKKVKS
jgi:hypothetical protein